MCGKWLKIEYHQVTKMKKRFEFRLQKTELELIKKNAFNCNMEFHAYVRKIAVVMVKIKLDHDSVRKHENQVIAYRNAIRGLFFKIKQIDKRIPKDLINILDITNELLKCEKQFMNMYLKYYFDENEKILNKSLQKSVDKYFKKSDFE